MIVAVFGTGNIGMRHIKVLNQIDAVNVIAIPKRQNRLGDLSREGHVVATDLNVAVKMGATHCVVATETGQHLEDGFQALDSGMNVLMEKPMCIDANQANRLAEHSKEKNKRLSVACLLRFSESLGIFRENLKSVGRLHSVRVESQSYLPSWQPGRHYQNSFRARPVEGGVLLDLIHDIDYPGWIFGWPERIQGNLKNLGRLGIDSDELANISWEGHQGETVSITMDFLSKPAHRSMTAYGEFGSVKWDDTVGRVDLWLDDQPDQEFLSNQTRDEAFLEQANQFLSFNQLDADCRVTSASEGAKALAICDAVRQSSNSRQEEVVHYP